MKLRDLPIRQKLMRGINLVSLIVLVVTCVIFFGYEYYSYRKTTVEKLSTIAKIVSANSTAALAFEDAADATEILSALKAEPHIVAACLYDRDGVLFAQYNSTEKKDHFPSSPKDPGFSFSSSYLEGFQPVIQGTSYLGALYLKTDLKEMYQLFQLYGLIVVFVVIISLVLAYLFSKTLQKSIAQPILVLAETAKIISDKKDYTVRATKLGHDEIGLLTDSFNLMLEEIQKQNQVLNEFNQTMEQKVRDRTAELENANKELESFSYSVSHDLRAPIRAIIGFSKILTENSIDKLNDDEKEDLNIIGKEASRMGQLIDDLLSFARLGKQDIQKKKTDMTALVKDVFDDILKFEPGKYHADIIINDLPPAYCDSALVRQVVVNLVSNSLKYSMTKEEPVIEVGAKEEAGMITYFIRDNGVGFDMKYYNKLFGVFQRLHGKEFEGTGIGLAIVHKIILRHGGNVWAEGKVNEGSVFYFSLPRR